MEENIKICENTQKESSPLDGELFIRYDKNYPVEINCGDVVIYPRGDGSLLIDRIGPMLGKDRCNVIRFDIEENRIRREYDSSFKSIVARIPKLTTFDGEGQELDINYQYIACDSFFKLVNDAYNTAVNNLNVFCAKLVEDYNKMLSPKNTECGEYVVKMIEKDEKLHSGQHLMLVMNGMVHLYRLNCHNMSWPYGGEWDAISYVIGTDRLNYTPKDTFSECLIMADVENPEPFETKRFVFCEIKPEVFDMFEYMHMRDTKKIQELREMTVNKISEIEYGHSVKLHTTNEN